MVKKTLTSLLLATGFAWANPNGPTVIQGGVQIQGTGPTMNVIQSTDRAIINWNGFSIGANELVRFLQPGQRAVILNRVVGTDPSLIMGQLSANGRVFLINPNGVLFGPQSRVDVGGLLASSLQMSDSDFMAGNYRLLQDPSMRLAAVVNQGELRVAEGGFVMLVAPTVVNEGLIVAQAGQVGLAGSRQATLSFDGQGLVEVTIPKGEIGSPGAVLLPQAAVTGILRDVVRDPGIAEVAELPRGEGLVLQSGAIHVDSPQQAGRVQLVSGQASIVTEGGQITANGGVRGGDVRVLSEGKAYLGGKLAATGQQGGFVELSGRQFNLKGQVDVRGRTSATAGVFLLDPETVTIVDTPNEALDDLLPVILAGDDIGSNLVSRAGLEAQPAGSEIRIEAQNQITVADMGGTGVIQLKNSVSLELVVLHGDLVFQDLNDSINAPGGIRIQLPEGGSSGLGTLTSQGDVTITAGSNLVVGTINTPVSEVTPTLVNVTAGGNLTVGSISGHSIRLEAGNDILDGNGFDLNVGGKEASFVAGNRVGTPEKPIDVLVDRISGQANEFHFEYPEIIPVEALVLGIDGLNVNPPPSPPPGPVPKPSFFQAQQKLIKQVDQIPVFQLNEQLKPLMLQPELADAPELGELALSLPGDAKALKSQKKKSGNGEEQELKSDPGEGNQQKSGQGEGKELKSDPGEGNQQKSGQGEGKELKSDPGEGNQQKSGQGEGKELKSDPGQGNQQVMAYEAASELASLPELSQMSDGGGTELVWSGSNVISLLDNLKSQGWKASATEDTILAKKGDLKMVGTITPGGTHLKILPAHSQAPANVDQGLVDALAFLSGLPGYQVESQQRVADSYKIKVSTSDTMPLFEALRRQGWRIEMTSDLMRGRKGEMSLSGHRLGDHLTLTVQARAQQEPVSQDFNALVTQFERDRQPVVLEVNPYALVALEEALRQKGWRSSLTSDQLVARKNGEKLVAVIEGNQATLAMAGSTAVPARPTSVTSGDFSFLAGLPGLRGQDSLEDYQEFTYDVGPRGLMPYIETLTERHFAVSATEDTLVGRQGGQVVLKGSLQGSRLVVRAGAPEVFRGGEVDTDLRHCLDWLRASREFQIVSEDRLVDITRLRVASKGAPTLQEMRAKFEKEGWAFESDGSHAVRKEHTLKLEPRGKFLMITVGRSL